MPRGKANKLKKGSGKRATEDESETGEEFPPVKKKYTLRSGKKDIPDIPLPPTDRRARSKSASENPFVSASPSGAVDTSVDSPTPQPTENKKRAAVAPEVTTPTASVYTHKYTGNGGPLGKNKAKKTTLKGDQTATAATLEGELLITHDSVSRINTDNSQTQTLSKASSGVPKHATKNDASPIDHEPPRPPDGALHEASASTTAESRTWTSSASASFASLGRQFTPPQHRGVPIPAADYAARASHATSLLSSLSKPMAPRRSSVPFGGSPLTAISYTRSTTSPTPTAAGERRQSSANHLPALHVVPPSDSSINLPMPDNPPPSTPKAQQSRGLNHHGKHPASPPLPEWTPVKTSRRGEVERDSDSENDCRARSSGAEDDFDAVEGVGGDDSASDTAEDDIDQLIHECDDIHADDEQSGEESTMHSQGRRSSDDEQIDKKSAHSQGRRSPAPEDQPLRYHGEETPQRGGRIVSEDDENDSDQSFKPPERLAAEKEELSREEREAWARAREFTRSMRENKTMCGEVDEVTTGFDDIDTGAIWEDEEDDLDEEEPQYQGKGKEKAAPRGPLPKAVIEDCEKFGLNAWKHASGLSKKHGIPISTVMQRAGLSLKRSAGVKQIRNAIRQVYAQEHRDEHKGVPAERAVIEAYVKQWLIEHENDEEAKQDMIAAATALEAGSLDNISVNKLRRQVLTVSQQFTGLGKTYLRTQGIFIVGVAIHLGDEFATSIFTSDADMLKKVIDRFGLADKRREILHKMKVNLQSHVDGIEQQVEKGLVPEKKKAAHMPITEVDFTPVKPYRDWLSSVIGRYLVDQIRLIVPCSRMIWKSWHSTAFKDKLVIIGTDRCMPFQPGPLWLGRKEGSLGQENWSELFRRIEHPANQHFSLPEGHLPLQVITLDACYRLFPAFKNGKQPAVVSTDGEILVFAGDVTGRSAEKLAVRYAVEPIPADTPFVCKKSTKAKGKGTAKEPIQLDVEGSDSEISSRALPKFNPPAQRVTQRINIGVNQTERAANTRLTSGSADQQSKRINVPRRHPVLGAVEMSDSEETHLSPIEKTALPSYIPRTTWSPLDLGPPIPPPKKKQRLARSSPPRTVPAIPERRPKRKYEEVDDQDALPVIRSRTRSPSRGEGTRYARSPSPIGRGRHTFLSPARYARSRSPHGADRYVSRTSPPHADSRYDRSQSPEGRMYYQDRYTGGFCVGSSHPESADGYRQYRHFNQHMESLPVPHKRYDRHHNRDYRDLRGYREQAQHGQGFREHSSHPDSRQRSTSYNEDRDARNTGYTVTDDRQHVEPSRRARHA